MSTRRRCADASPRWTKGEPTLDDGDGLGVDAAVSLGGAGPTPASRPVSGRRPAGGAPNRGAPPRPWPGHARPLGSNELVGDPGCLVSEHGPTNPAGAGGAVVVDAAAVVVVVDIDVIAGRSVLADPDSSARSASPEQATRTAPITTDREHPPRIRRRRWQTFWPASPRSSRVDGPPLTDPTGPALARNPSRRSPNASKVTRGSADRCAAAATGRRRFVALLCGDSRGARTPVPSRLDRTLEGHFGQSFPGRRPSDGGMRPWPSFSFSQATGGTRLAVA